MLFAIKVLDEHKYMALLKLQAPYNLGEHRINGRCYCLFFCLQKESILIYKIWIIQHIESSEYGGIISKTEYHIFTEDIGRIIA